MKAFSKKDNTFCIVFKFNLMVGVAGFEPVTFCSQSRRDTKLRYTPRIRYYKHFYLLFNYLFL